MFLNYILPLIISIIFIVLFVVLCTTKLKNASEQKKLMPIKIVFYVLLALEVAKIFYLIGVRKSYEPSRYPIVFCSMVLYAYPLFCFKKNRFSELAKSFSILPCFIVFLLFAAIQWQYNMTIVQAHSYVFHAAMLAVSIYLLTSKLYKFEFKKAYPLFGLLSGYVLFSTVLSLFLGGDISYFGPKSAFIKPIYNMFGYAVGNVLIAILFFVLCTGVYGIIALCQRKKNKSTEKSLTGEVEHA